MRRAIVTTTATAAGVVLLLSLKPHGAQSASAQAPVISSGSDAGSSSNGSSSTPAPDATSSTASTPSSRPSAKATTKSSGTSSDKPATKATTASYTGQAVDTRYGPVQVRIDVSNGKIGKIDVLQYPNGSQRDADINGYALPVLNQEALAAQNAQIDAVSGATYTSGGYTQSLQSALDQAGLK
jgi:uncharacterized protein with FMN-binding domain